MYKAEETLGVDYWKNHFLSFNVKRISARDHKKEMELSELPNLQIPQATLVLETHKNAK